MGKRNRCTNWESDEKELLWEILHPFISIIENKDLSTNTNKSKIRAWMEITERFNRANVRLRDKKQIMNQWKIIKIKLKKGISDYKKNSYQTCDDSKPPSPCPDSLDVVSMMTQELEEDDNELDCDSIKDKPTEEHNDNNKMKPYGNYEEWNEAISNGYLSSSKLHFMEPTLLTSHNQLTPLVSNQTPSTSQPASSNNQPTTSTSKTDPSTSQPYRRQRPAKKPKVLENSLFNFRAQSYKDMHKIRSLESERSLREHEQKMLQLENDLVNKNEEHKIKIKILEEEQELRKKIMLDCHEQIMKNLKLQEELLKKKLNSES